jgi:hypothetical protein
MVAHNQKKRKNTKKEKSRYSDQFLKTADETTRTTPEVQLLQKRCLQEGNRAQAPSSLDHRS